MEVRIFSTLPSFVFTPVSGGTGASATATVNFGVNAVITPSILKTYSYTWDIPDLVINDLARLSTINIIATNFTNTTPYIYRIQGLQYDSRNSFFSDYNSPILSIAQNTNVCSFGSLGGTPFSLILSSQTIRQIIITVDDSITTIGTGQSTNINFIIAIEIEEFNPEFEEKTHPYQEAKSRIKRF
jgi:hypothetical protein